VPDFICTVVCAGLNTKTVLTGEDNYDTENDTLVSDPKKVVDNFAPEGAMSDGSAEGATLVAFNRHDKGDILECETTMP